MSENDEKVYTIVPEVFVLPEMMKNPKPFNFRLVRGHFERGGKTILQKGTATIKRIVFSKKFDRSAHQPRGFDGFFKFLAMLWF